MPQIQELEGRFKVTEADRRVVAEFKKNPVGHHTPELQQVLNRFRGAPMADKYCLIIETPFKKWRLGQTTGDRAQPVKPLDKTFTSLEDAEWHVFKLRWKMHTGETLK
ncbi:MAG: ABC transporter permease [Alphaproteobacteria bacterium]|nr:ABC transporter permease [Alphaproteobacteria bacterium]